VSDFDVTSTVTLTAVTESQQTRNLISLAKIELYTAGYIHVKTGYGTTGVQ